MFRFIGIAVFVLVASSIGSFDFSLAAAADKPEIAVYKGRFCGCCSEWVEHLKASGFDARVYEVSDTTPYREKNGVPEALASCHTAVIAGYAIEGHVPAADIMRLLREHPKARGIAVPAMPMGSPGMRGPRKDPYETLLFDASGKYAVFERH